MKCLFVSNRNAMCDIFKKVEKNPVADMFSGVLCIDVSDMDAKSKYCPACLRSAEHVQVMKDYVHVTRHAGAPSMQSTPVDRKKRMLVETPQGKAPRKKTNSEEKENHPPQGTPNTSHGSHDHSYGRLETFKDEMKKKVSKNLLLEDKKEQELYIAIDSACDRLCSRETPSVLRMKTDLDSMQDHDFLGKVMKELEAHLPVLFNVLKAVAIPIGSIECKQSVMTTMAVAYGMLMFCRNRDLCGIQKMLSTLVIHFNGGNAMLDILNKGGLTMSSGSKIYFLDQLAKLNMEAVVKSLRRGMEGKITTDNIDGEIRPSEMRKGEKRRFDYHYSASTYLPDRSVKLANHYS